MSSRFSRVAVVAAFLVPVLGNTSPAPAVYAFSTVFVGQLTVAGGLDYPCNPTMLGSLPCPPGIPTFDPLFVQDDPVPQGHLDWGHNTRPATMSSTVCVNGGVGVLKSLGPLIAGSCSLTLGGTVTGWCGLGGGQTTGTEFNGHSDITVDIHYIQVGGTMFMTGHWWKPIDGQHGLVLGLALVVPPHPVQTPGQSCLDKTASTFTVVGTLAFVSSLLL